MGKGEGSGDGKGQRDEDQRIAVPALPMPVAVLCCILNFLIPGLGKLEEKSIDRLMYNVTISVVNGALSSIAKEGSGSYKSSTLTLSIRL